MTDAPTAITLTIIGGYAGCIALFVKILAVGAPWVFIFLIPIWVLAVGAAVKGLGL